MLDRNDSGAGKVDANAVAQMQFQAGKKSVGLAYVLWFFLGWLGGHRFYLGSTGSGAAILIISVISFILSFVAVGLLGFVGLGIWLLVDLFLIPGIADKKNQELINSLK